MRMRVSIGCKTLSPPAANEMGLTMTQTPDIMTPERSRTRFLDKSAAVMLGLTIFYIPFPYLTSLKEVLFYLPVTIAIGFLATGKKAIRFQQPLLTFLYIFAAWALLTAFFSLDPKASFNDVFFHLIKYILYCYALLTVMASRARFRSITWILFISGCVFAAELMVRFYLLENRSITLRLGGFGLTEISTNLIAVVTAVAFVFGLQLYSRSKIAVTRFGVILGLVILAGVTISTQSRAAFLALIASGTVYMFFRGQRAFIAVSLLLVALAATFYMIRSQVGTFSGIGSYRTNVRISLGLMAIDVTNDYPITGIGFGTDIFGTRIDHEMYNERLPEPFRRSPSNLKSHTTEPHATFFSIAVRTGWPGLVFFCLFIGSFFRVCIRLIRSSADEEITSWAQCLMASMVTMLVVGIFERCLSPVTDMVFYTIVGMVGILWQLDASSDDIAYRKIQSSPIERVEENPLLKQP